MFAVVYIPNFSLQAVLRHTPELREAAVALVDDDSAKAKVSQVTRAAQRAGVLPEMSSTQAKARCDKIVFRLKSGAQEEAAQEILLECAYLSAAFIESTGPGVCTLDLRGLPVLKAERLDEALRAWAGELRARLAGFEFDGQIGVAAAPALALQAARGSAAFYYVKDPAAFWGTLPIESLCPAGDLLKVLEKWGIHTVGQFLALGKSRIAERLGSGGLELYDAAKADRVRPLRLTSPRQVYEEYFEFEQLIETLEPLLFSVRRLLEQLVRRLELVSLAMAEIVLSLQLESGKRHESSIKIASPTREVNALFRIAHNYLETVRTSSPVVGVSVKAIPCEVESQQFQLFETSVRDPNRFYETVSRLSAMLGADRVGTPVVRDSFRSDDFELVRPSVNLQPAADKASLGITVSGGEITVQRRGPALRRFRPPLAASVRLKEGAPVFFSSSGPGGAISRAQGPWRSSGNWWESLWAREEWDVQMKDGSLYRLFFDTKQWFVEGAYD